MDCESTVWETAQDAGERRSHPFLGAWPRLVQTGNCVDRSCDGGSRRSLACTEILDADQLLPAGIAPAAPLSESRMHSSGSLKIASHIATLYRT